MAAMIDVVGRQGAAATTVEDVVAAAGMSRKTFYRHFENKQDCLLSSADVVIDISMREVERAYTEKDVWPGRVDAALRALFRLASDHPGAVRLSLVEVGVAGAAGLERRQRWFGAFERFIADALAQGPQPSEAPELVVKAMVGGVAGVLSRRLLPNGRRLRLTPLIPDLVAWITSYRPTPATLSSALRAERSAPPTAPGPRTGGRAPGTLAPHGRRLRRRGLPRGDNNPSHSFVVHNQRERILDAVARLTAAHGYAAVKVEDIVVEAAISLKAFYEHFANKDDAFVVAYEVGHAKCLAYVEAAYDAESEWTASVHSGLWALMDFLASEPAFARIALVDVLTATPLTAERSSLGVSAFARLLVAGLDDLSATALGGQPRPSEASVDAIAGGVFEVCLNYAVADRVAELHELTPVLTYFTLAPFVGTQRAAKVISRS